MNKNKSWWKKKWDLALKFSQNHENKIMKTKQQNWKPRNFKGF